MRPPENEIISTKIDELLLKFDGSYLCLRRGDLLFGYRRSWLQLIMNVSGDPMTHSAVIGSVKGELRAVELGPKGMFSRSIEDFTKAYLHVCVLRPAMAPACIDRLASTAERHLAEKDLAYSWSACALLEASALIRRFSRARSDEDLQARTLDTAARLHERLGPRTVTCSGFVARCLTEACADCADSLTWPVRERVSPWTRYPTIFELLRSRPNPARMPAAPHSQLLLTPADLFVGTPAEYRAVIGGGRTTVLVDVEAASACAA